MNTIVMQEYKERSGLSYEQIAESTGLAKSTVSRLFTDPKYNPTIDTVQSVLTLIGGSIDKACDMATPPTPDGTDLTEALRTAAAQSNRLYAECAAQKKIYHRIIGVSLLFNFAFVAFIMGFVIYDVTHPSIGFVQYTTALVPTLSNAWESIALWAKTTLHL